MMRSILFSGFLKNLLNCLDLLFLFQNNNPYRAHSWSFISFCCLDRVGKVLVSNKNAELAVPWSSSLISSQMTLHLVEVSASVPSIKYNDNSGFGTTFKWFTKWSNNLDLTVVFKEPSSLAKNSGNADNSNEKLAWCLYFYSVELPVKVQKWHDLIWQILSVSWFWQFSFFLDQMFLGCLFFFNKFL